MMRLTPAARAASSKINVQPDLVFKLSKFNKIYGSAEISEFIRIGDPDLEIGNDWVIGGVRAIQDQSPYISFNTGGGGTTTQITQKLAPDRKEGTTITSMVVSLIDKNEEITQLISPGFDIEDALGTECEVSLGYKGTAYPEDYEIIFRGIVNDIESGPGYVNFMLSSVEDKKRRAILIENITELTAPIPLGNLSSVEVADASAFLLPIAGPDGNIDTSFQGVFRINDEFFTYDSVSGNTLLGIERAQFGSIAAEHEIEDEVSRGIRLQGHGIDLALKLMLSGWEDFFVENVKLKHINRISAFQPRQNAVFFERLDLTKVYGLTVGDFVTIEGAIEVANNVTKKQILEIQVTDDGSFLVLDDVSFMDELDSPGTAKFYSKYNTFPIGLRMSPAEVDVAQHEFLRDSYLNGWIFDLNDLFEIQTVKTILDEELYTPMACFAIPRGGRASVTYSIGPIADQEIKTINLSNVQNANQLRVRRSLSTNFNNTVKYAYDHDPVEDEFLSVSTYSSQVSKSRVPIGDKVLDISSKGLRTGQGASFIENSANRLLQRYQFGAEYINGVQMIWKDGFPLEIGDVVIVDYRDLKLSDTDTGNRSGNLKFMEVLNKTTNVRTGQNVIDLVNTSFSAGDRFATIAPSSKIDAGSIQSKLNLKQSYGTTEFESESVKWQDYEGEKVLIHSPDWSFEFETTIDTVSLSPAALILNPPLPSMPQADWIVDLANYPDEVNAEINKKMKLLHVFLSATVPLVGVGSSTKFAVNPSDIDKFKVGSPIQINNEDYSNDLEESVIIEVDTNTNEITIEDDAGFIIDNTHVAKLLSFKDGGQSYRYI